MEDNELLDDNAPERKFSPMVVKSVVPTALCGVLDPEHITPAHVERQSLSMRMGMHRFTRLTNAFRKKALNPQRSLALYFMHYNLCRKHMTLKTMAALAAGFTDRFWTAHDLVLAASLLWAA
jgi:hypothetical protein